MKNKKEIKSEEKKDWIELYKTDKKFNAKVQLIGYGIFIFIVIIGLNISAASGNRSNRDITSMKSSINNQTNRTTNKKIALLQKINNNYEYDIKVELTTKKDETTETKKVEYSGKSYKNNMEIIKKDNNESKTYYKIDSRYYKKENDDFEIIKSDEIYDTLEKEYIELDNIKEYLDKSTLDHVTEYSSGKKEYVYHMRVKEIIKSYPEIDEIEIKALEENNTLTIEIDYLSLMKVLSRDNESCIVTYTYKNIDTVEEFSIMEYSN